jgi:hypothetical protein
MRSTLGFRAAFPLTVALLAWTGLAAVGSAASAASIEVALSPSVAKSAVDGRVILALSKDEKDEPRNQVAAGVDAIQVFGVDVDGLSPGGKAVVDGKVFGYPIESLDRLPAGRYRAQAVLHRYETFHRADGHVVKLPEDRGEGQHWNLAPGNFLSKPEWIDFDPARGEAIHLTLDGVIPPIQPPGDTPYVKHIRIQSERLTKFWGRPVYLGAHVLLPEGFEEHPDARYPLMLFHGHFPDDLSGFRTTPPDPNLPCKRSERFDLDCYNRTEQEEAYAFYQKWRSPGFPRFLVVEVQHANPYYDDSYAVNSANLGPYGDAINYELLPEIERRFRAIGQGWARFVYGGSTGGWEALAVQVFYPELFNGAFVACPDPIDFRAYTTVDIYSDKNAYADEGPFTAVERPGHRNYLGHVQGTLRDYNHLELVLGTHSRSGDQFDIWEAVYSPVGADGYPQRIWDKRTGVIDPAVAAYWREHYDLRHILERDWAKLAPQLIGKIHLYVGDMDNYYLNNAVYLAEAFLKKADPPYGGEVAYGDRAEHCWNGDPTQPNAVSRLRYNTMYVERILARIQATAPAGADLTSWRY